MLRWLFQNLDTSLGPTLEPAGHVLYVGGLLLLGVMVARAWWTVWVERAAAGAGVTAGWIASCRTCRARVPLRGAACAVCGTPLAVPFPLRLRLTSSLDRGRVGRAMDLAGALLFTLACAFFALSVQALIPAGPLHRFFLGAGLVGFALAAGACARALGSSGNGVVSRAGAGLQALAAAGLTVVALFFAEQSRPAQASTLLRIEVSTGGARVGEHRLSLSNGELAVDYVQLDHATLGYHHVVPLAVVGAERAQLPLSYVDSWLLDWLIRHSEELERRGLLVRRRTDRRAVEPGHSYELVDREGQVGIHRVDRPPASPPAKQRKP
ncbi:MAG: hypothetical protein ACOZIN_02165 [Myxococcota bacterium]